ncbi:hypothetical protein QR680_014098 [Steinernema hermaphroditum]|uniref:Uncharacterized protein n=1 Tax=Steinernema hermaphroditum TaxID=289476 RepID=A0AA39I7P0_9BILA|nr:hypothetical protein QR680_014098 [Steinernema hermaphroditum]
MVPSFASKFAQASLVYLMLCATLLVTGFLQCSKRKRPLPAARYPSILQKKTATPVAGAIVNSKSKSMVSFGQKIGRREPMSEKDLKEMKAEMCASDRAQKSKVEHTEVLTLNEKDDDSSEEEGSRVESSEYVMQELQAEKKVRPAPSQSMFVDIQKTQSDEEDDTCNVSSMTQASDARESGEAKDVVA